nr:Chain C, PHE-ARG-TYR-ASN-GLY-LEU-ILE-HIS-ARG peptide [synthetic construct]7T0L_F Chain F, PHE-ARG-TYR-ASN-GLY-LEU-ILE-HIS-ARG peptide [synthetic construct]
FRYNGLIHR